MLLQEFEEEITDKQGANNLAADHLSPLEHLHLDALWEKEIDDSLPEEHLYGLQKVRELETP